MNTDIQILNEVKFYRNDFLSLYNTDCSYMTIDGLAEVRVYDIDAMLERVEYAHKNALPSNLIFPLNGETYQAPIKWIKPNQYDDENESLLICVNYNLMSKYE